MLDIDEDEAAAAEAAADRDDGHEGKAEVVRMSPLAGDDEEDARGGPPAGRGVLPREDRSDGEDSDGEADGPEARARREDRQRYAEMSERHRDPAFRDAVELVHEPARVEAAIQKLFVTELADVISTVKHTSKDRVLAIVRTLHRSWCLDADDEKKQAAAMHSRDHAETLFQYALGLPPDGEMDIACPTNVHDGHANLYRLVAGVHAIAAHHEVMDEVVWRDPSRLGAGGGHRDEDGKGGDGDAERGSDGDDDGDGEDAPGGGGGPDPAGEAEALRRRPVPQLLAGDQVTVQQVLNMLYGQMHYGRALLLNEMAFEDCRHRNTFTTRAPTALGFELETRANQVKAPDVRLFLHCLNQATVRGLRRLNRHVYREITTPEGHRTHAWEKHMKMEEFVDSCCPKETLFHKWVDKFKHKNVVVEKLCTDVESELRDLVDDREVTAWRNGILFARQRVFIRYASNRVVPDTIVATKYFDVNYHDDRYGHKDAADREHREPAIFGIQHDVRHILARQGYTKSEQVWVLGLLGGMIFEKGSLDNWELGVALIGWSGTGKGTIGELVAELFRREDVGVLSNNHEETFGLAGLMRKIVIAFDLKESKMSVGDLQTILSGEPTSCPVKGGDKVDLTWVAPILLLMNEFPPSWRSAVGALERRLVAVRMDEPVPRGMRDNDLKKKCKANYGAFYLLILECYHHLLEHYGKGGRDIWASMPAKLRNGTRSIQEIGNSFHAYLNDEDEIEAEPTGYVHDQQLVDSYRAYCVARHVKPMPLPREKLENYMKVHSYVCTFRVDHPRTQGADGDLVTGRFFGGLRFKKSPIANGFGPPAPSPGAASTRAAAGGGGGAGSSSSSRKRARPGGEVDNGDGQHAGKHARPEGGGRGHRPMPADGDVVLESPAG